jgi:nucleolar MIF4G domain-containing protein 1
MLDTIRDNGGYEDDERFTKRQKIKGPSVLHRKENRKQQRLNKKKEKLNMTNEFREQHKQRQKDFVKQLKKKQNLKPSKPSKSDNNLIKKKSVVLRNPQDSLVKNKEKRVSFSDTNDIREIPARDSFSDNEIDVDFEKWEKDFTSDSDDSEQFFSNSENDSQDEKDEEEAHNLIETLKHLKQVQRGEYRNSEEEEEEEEEAEEEEQDEDEDGEEEALDDEQLSVMSKLAALKGKKSTNTLRIVKEDELDDDDLSEEEQSESDEEKANEYEDFDDEQQKIMDQLAALKSKKTKSSISEIRVVHEDDLSDDFVSEEESEGESEGETDNEELDAEQLDVFNKLAQVKGKRQSSSSPIKIIQEDDLENDDTDSEDEEVVENEAFEDLEELDDEQQTIMNQLAALKGNKKMGSSKLKIVKEDELGDDSFSEEKTEDEEISEGSEEEYVTPDFGISKDDNEIDYYAGKLGIDPKKGLKRQDENDFVGGLFEGLDFMDNYDESIMQNKKVESKEQKEKSNKKETKKEKSFKKVVSDHDREMLRKDKEDMEFYAKKLGIDSTKGISKQGDDDLIGGLFDGLDLDFGDEMNIDSEQETSNDSEVDEESEEEELQKGRKSRKTENGDDDEIDSDDFDDDDDLDDDDKALLKEMYGLESSDENSDSNSDSDFEGDGPRVKENPYIAPVQPGDDQEPTPAGSKYIPPALRKKIAMGENIEDSETIKKLIRLVKGPFNKLSEPNLNSAVSELNNLYNDHPRQFVNDAILRVIIQSVAISTPMLESFLVLYASAIVALYKLQGIEFGAFVLQKIVEEFTKNIESELRAKQDLLNVTGLLGYLYTLNFVSSTLIYDVIKMKLISNPSELKTDVLLKLIKSCGTKLRTDDSTALNSIIGELNKAVKENEKKGIKASTRTRFLIDTITDLKNNRLKNLENENTTSMINRIKKQLGSINSSRNLDAIKVNLDDIESIEERGKWWLVGSAWKGNEVANKESNNKIDNIENVNDNLLDDEDQLSSSLDVNWMELAIQCRMNTDIRRAIFISIMSAEDFMDAFIKLEKLNLKKSQKAEIPNILMHCATMEASSNPYYSYLAKKLCDDHSMRRSFQLNLWDFVKELDGDDSSTTILTDANEDERLWKILNMGRFFGFLIGEGSLSLNVLRIINFLTASSDVKIFLEIMLITILDVIGKKSEVNIFGSGKDKKKNKDVTYTGKLMAERVNKCDEQPLLMKGLQYFLNNKIRDSGFIKGKKQRLRIEWGVDMMSEMLTGLLKSQK